MQRILALTSIRSDYDLMSHLYEVLREDAQVDLRLLVSGAHLAPAFGYTVANIHSDGFRVLAQVETLVASDSASARLKTAASLLFGTIDIVRQFAPDVLLFAGDREDVLVGGMLGAFLGIPTVHFFGGDHAADGHVDNPVRHATSKLATAHFVSTPEHRARLLRLGEPDHRIFVIGSVALDKFRLTPSRSRAEVLAAMGAKPHAAQARLAVLIFHPVEAEREHAGQVVLDMVRALHEAGFHVCIGSSNTDPGNAPLMATFQLLDADERVTFYRNMGRVDFVNLLRLASLIIGNSSAGLLESASVNLPAINVGARQRGRMAGANVVFCDADAPAIRQAIARVQSEDFAATLGNLQNPYGDGRSAERAATLIRELDLRALLAKTEDPLHDE